jgi:hypothetical protein
MSRIVCCFSCGAASAIATKLALAEYGHERVHIVNAFIVEEHPDNRRFLSDCEKWFNHPVTVLRDEIYGASVREVWRRKRFIANGSWGAPCSKALKKSVLDAWAQPDDISVIGYTLEEQDRADRMLAANEGKFIFPLIDRNLTHADCLGMVERAGLVLPLMYRLGYNNANCVGCCKGGEGYWNKIRRDFPKDFEECAAIQEIIGPSAYLFRDRKTGVRYSLRDLPPNKGRHKEELPDCGVFCELAEKELESDSTIRGKRTGGE